MNLAVFGKAFAKNSLTFVLVFANWTPFPPAFTTPHGVATCAISATVFVIP